MRVKEIRMRAKECLKGKWAKTSVLIFLFSLLVNLAMIGYTVLNTVAVVLENKNLEYISLIFIIPGYIVQAILQLGLLRVILGVARGKDYKFSDMFWGAKYWLKTLGVMFMTTLFTLLWMCLFIVPGIIKAISYSMSLFILAENPEKGILECITESRMMMKGNKGKYFGLTLSISIWLILYAVVMIGCVCGSIYLIAEELGSIIANVLILLAVMFLLIIGYTILAYVLTSYLYVAQGVMYLDISKKDEVNSDVAEEIVTESTDNLYAANVEDASPENVEDMVENKVE